MIIPVSRPKIGEAEFKYVNNALSENAISGIYGEYIPEFEREFANFCDAKYAISCSNGTAALHLGLTAAGIKSGDEVLVSTLTNMATFFAVLYIGAKPVPIDIDPITLNIDPKQLEAKISSSTKAILVVHLFGHPCDMDPIIEIAKKNNLLVIEDCAEAHGALYKGKKVGAIGDVGCFSFFANKIITTGEGGIVTTNNEVIANKARSLKALAFGVKNKFMHQDLGFNYRMTNIQAAIGCGQMERADELVAKRRYVADFYSKRLKKYSEYLALPVELSYAKNSYWMYHIVIKKPYSQIREQLMNSLRNYGVETREGFVPANLQEIFIKAGWTKPEDCTNANSVAYSTFYLPSGPDISDDELHYVCEKFDLSINSLLI